MGLVSNWMHVDFFTVDQAAALWNGFDPGRLALRLSIDRPSEFVAAKQMLVSGIVSGEVSSDTSQNPLHRIGDHGKTLVSRQTLELFAKKRKLFPPFLFDTLAPLGERQSGDDTNNKWQLDTLLPEPAFTPVNRGGRPPEYDWDTFLMEIIRRANLPDGLPETQADLIRDMLVWFLDTSGREPAESAVKQRISKIYAYFREARNLSE